MNNSDLRMVFFVRTDLKMPKGKIAAQVGHAVQYSMEKLLEPHKLTFNQTLQFYKWLDNGLSTKICLKVSSEEELLAWHCLGSQKGFPTTLVKDEGLTCFNGEKTLTVVGWGPIYKEEHQELTSGLKLL